MFLAMYAVVVVGVTIWVVCLLARCGWLSHQLNVSSQPAVVRRKHRKRDVATQSQTTYSYVSQPLGQHRFVPLADRDQGAWIVA